MSIKGVYYQAEVLDQTVTWLVPYQFTQNVSKLLFSLSKPCLMIISQIPSDVDVRVMLTFLELYQTLLGFVFFKLYADAALIYPPPLDANKEESGAGVGAFSLQVSTHAANTTVTPKANPVDVDSKKISSKDVRQTIKNISATISIVAEAGEDIPDADPASVEADEDFVTHPSTSKSQESATLTTLQTLKSLPQSSLSKLFAPYTFWLSRETSRPIFEFLIRSFGGKIGWPATSGSGSPYDEADDAITHVIIDRPIVVKEGETDEERERRHRRKHVQPQWVVDCINAGKILLEESYAQGKTLPPHLSPFEDRQGAYDPTAGLSTDDIDMEEEESEVEDTDNLDSDEEDEAEVRPEKLSLKAVAAAEDPAALRVAELEAEAAGVDYGTFEQVSKKVRNKEKDSKTKHVDEREDDMNKMMMSNKQKKLYERMKFGEKKRTVEVSRSRLFSTTD